MAVAIANLTLKASVLGELTNALDLTTPSDRIRELISLSFANGTGASQANNIFHDQRTLATGASEDLDLSGTSLQNAFGANLALTKLKGILVHNKTGNTTNITVSRPAANGVPLFGAASGALAALPPGGFFFAAFPSAAGVTVTATTGDLITITNSAGASADYEIFLIGA